MPNVIDQCTSGTELIPGYILRDRIGSGGFGEVWSAEAPGGLEKAIKMVFGTMDNERAKRELRSLERLRRVHHPFLLTLERFEVVQNHLVIVTERADEGLDQVAARYQSKGLPGIPRDELLNYLTEAADALDHLREKYGLQHLDIKPANLLILSGHMKVADFGLVKDLRECEQSIVGGLTPTYAAPEVFDGQPSIHSDQYSLAIVYQELLTGQRPFNGRTIAQLATQHVHSAPQLESLPVADRPVIARALEKNPERRFESCSELMRRLREGSRRPTQIPVASAPCEPAGETMLGGPLGANVKNASTPLKLAETTHRIGTALLVGIGGMGADVLAKVRKRQPDSQRVRMEYLLVDTDGEALEKVCLAGATGHLNWDQTFHAGLRTAHDYREVQDGRLRTVSRRWLYNVPRSAKTEGLRPLGRLSMVDHAPKLLARLRQLISTLPSDQDCVVYVIASVAGGTGSGMVWDMVHVLRDLLDSSNRAQVPIQPLVAGAWPGNHRTNPLHFAATLAALREATHFANPGFAYPGDAGAGFAPVPAGRTPLRDAYVFASQGEESLSDLVSDYLLLNVGAASGVLAAARGDGTSKSHGLHFRSAGVAKLQFKALASFDRLVREAVFRGLKQLLGKPTTDNEAAGTTADGLLRHCDVTISAAQQLWNSLRKLPDVSQWQTLITERFPAYVAQVRGADAVMSGTMMLHLADQFAMDTTRAAFPELDPAETISRIQQELHGLLNKVNLSLPFLVDVSNALQQKLQAHAEAMRELAQEADAEATSIYGEIRGIGEVQLSRMQADQQRVIDWILLRMQAIQAAALQQLFEFYRDSVSSIAGSYSEQTRRAIALTAHVRSGIDSTTRLSREQATVMPVGLQAVDDGDSLQKAIRDVVAQIRQSVISEEIAEDPAEAVVDFESLASRILSAAGFRRPDHESISEFLQRLSNHLAETRPPLLDCGGEQRRILIVGDPDQKRMMEPLITEAIKEPIEIVVASGADVTFVHEAQGIAVESVVSRLTTALGPDLQVVDRLWARTDLKI